MLAKPLFMRLSHSHAHDYFLTIQPNAINSLTNVKQLFTISLLTTHLELKMKTFLAYVFLFVVTLYFANEILTILAQ